MIPGYDEWKTAVPDDGEPVSQCINCNAGLYHGDEALEGPEGEFCDEDCALDYYGCRTIWIEREGVE